MNAELRTPSILRGSPRKFKKTRTRLRERTLPAYTKGEEIFNMVSHIVGGAFGVATLALCVIIAAFHSSIIGIVCGAIFGASMITLYTMSSLYHGLHVGTAKKVFQIFDHCTIYFLIAGTYTPVLLCGMLPTYPLPSLITLSVVWGLTALSVTLTAIDLEKYKVFGMIAYVGMGWAIIFSIKKIYLCIGPAAFALLLGGGLAYTLGIVFFKLGKQKKYFHSVFHLFVLLGSVCHSLCVILFII